MRSLAGVRSKRLNNRPEAVSVSICPSLPDVSVVHGLQNLPVFSVTVGPWHSRAGSTYVGHNGDTIARSGLTGVNHNLLRASEAS